MLVRRLPRPIRDEVSKNSRLYGLQELLIALWPVVAVILGSVGLGIELAFSLVVVILLVILIHRPSMEVIRRALKRGFSPRLIMLIPGVMGFKKIIEVTGAAKATFDVLSAIHFPPVLLAFMVPLSAGLLTGVTVAAVGLSFPLLLPILQGSNSLLNVTALAFGGSFMGVLLSPFHLCLVLTREYFEARWGPIYRLILPSVALVSGIAFLLYLLLPGAAQ